MVTSLIQGNTDEIVTIIAMFSLLLGFCFINQGVSVLTSDLVQGFVLVALGILNMSIPVGLSFVAKWSWTLQIMMFIELIVVAMLLFLSKDSEHMIVTTVAFIVNASILCFMFRSHAKAYFRKLIGIEYLRYYLNKV